MKSLTSHVSRLTSHVSRLTSHVLVLCLAITLCCQSCQRDVATETPKVLDKKGIVPLSTARDIAKDFFRMYYLNTANKEIQEEIPVEENGKPYFYIFNYKDGGFLILSAEYGQTPILANGLRNTFPSKGEINPGLGSWLLSIKAEAEGIRQEKILPQSGVEQFWNKLEKHELKANFSEKAIRESPSNVTLRSGGGGGTVDPCSPMVVEVGPLVTTEWDQGCFYNELVPQSGNFCNKAPTGCVATAMAQIAKYHNLLDTFNFSQMPDRVTSKNLNVASLMKWCGGALYTSYGASSSNASSANLPFALTSNGYASGITYADYEPAQFTQNINLLRPVILRGCTELCSFWGWYWGCGDCHAWVADGYQRFDYPYGCNSSGGLLLHMNWGWGGSGPNDWYAVPRPLNLPNYHFQYGYSMVSNIHP